MWGPNTHFTNLNEWEVNPELFPVRNQSFGGLFIYFLVVVVGVGVEGDQSCDRVPVPRQPRPAAAQLKTVKEVRRPGSMELIHIKGLLR